MLMKFCAEGAILSQLQSTSLAVLDAVLEDKPAQPLPCGSYLVTELRTKLLQLGCQEKEKFEEVEQGPSRVVGQALARV